MNNIAIFLACIVKLEIYLPILKSAQKHTKILEPRQYKGVNYVFSCAALPFITSQYHVLYLLLFAFLLLVCFRARPMLDFGADTDISVKVRPLVLHVRLKK